MNILYLSHLSGASYAGPTYSVPKQIEAQSKLDNVFWYNAVKESKTEWMGYTYYHDLTEYPEESIECLPVPFNNPDIIIVELFYNMTKSPLLKELIKGKIPYVIIPRGELTAQGQARKSLKKKIANILICKKYARKALAIQYLTEQEYRDSGNSWNKNYIIIPNGIDLPLKVKKSYSANEIKCVSIGRIEPYQKGLDLLIDACVGIKTQLLRANCKIIICGPDKENKLEYLNKKIIDNEMDSIISFHDAVYGSEKEKMLLDSDVFLITSRFEGHPMALIEALSYGLPAVTTTGSNMREKVEQNNAGWGAENTSQSIEKAIKQMLSDVSLLKVKGENAIMLANKYSWELIASESRNKYLEMCNKRTLN